MDQTTLLYVMTAFVIISAVALSIQAGMLLLSTRNQGTSRQDHAAGSASAIAGGNHQSHRRAEPEADRRDQFSRQRRADSTRNQLAMVEEVVSDATSRAKVQMDRVELVLDDTLSRAHETVALLHSGIMPSRCVRSTASPPACAQLCSSSRAAIVPAWTSAPATKRCLSELY